MIDVLVKCPLFKGIKSEDIEKLISSVNYNKKKFSKKDLIELSGTQYNSLMILIKGTAKGEMTDFSGKTIKIEDIETPRPLAFVFLFASNNKIPVDIVASTDCEILFISKQDVIKLMQANDTFLSNYLNAVANRADFLSKKIKFLSFKTIKGKIAHYLLELSNKGELKSIELPKTQQELADFFAITRPSFARALGEMAEERIIYVNRKKVDILDKIKLIGLIK